MQVDLSVLRPSSMSIAVANSQFSRRLDTQKIIRENPESLHSTRAFIPGEENALAGDLSFRTLSMRIEKLLELEKHNGTDEMLFLLNGTRSVTCKIIGVIIHIRGRH